MEEQKTFPIATLKEIQKKVDKMPFMLILVVCTLCVITFFVIMMFKIGSVEDYVKDNVSSTEYLIEKLEKAGVIEKEILNFN